MTLHIYAPKPVAAWKKWMDCPTCDKRTIFVCQHIPWHGMNSFCTECGDSWSDCERNERPFERGWRKKAIAYAQQLAAEITTDVVEYGGGLPDYVRDAIMADIERDNEVYPHEQH